MAYEGLTLLVGRVLFGWFFVMMGFNHFRNREMLTGYAESKGVPAAEVAVVATGAMMLLGGTGIILGAYPVVSSLLVALFLVVTTPLMHDFWAADEEDKMDEMTNFMKNTALLGGALIFAAITLTGTEMMYSLGLGLL